MAHTIVWADGDATVRNNVFVQGGGIQTYLLAAGTYETSTAEIVNNTFYGDYIQVRADYGTTEWINNALVGNFVFTDFGATPVFEHNLLWAPSYPPEVSGTNIVGDPLFLDPENLDFHYPYSDSALVDAGHPDILDPDGSRSDIGTYGGPDADW